MGNSVDSRICFPAEEEGEKSGHATVLVNCEAFPGASSLTALELRDHVLQKVQALDAQNVALEKEIRALEAGNEVLDDELQRTSAKYTKLKKDLSSQLFSVQAGGRAPSSDDDDDDDDAKDKDDAKDAKDATSDSGSLSEGGEAMAGHSRYSSQESGVTRTSTREWASEIDSLQAQLEETLESADADASRKFQQAASHGGENKGIVHKNSSASLRRGDVVLQALRDQKVGSEKALEKVIQRAVNNSKHHEKKTPASEAIELLSALALLTGTTSGSENDILRAVEEQIAHQRRIQDLGIHFSPEVTLEQRKQI